MKIKTGAITIVVALAFLGGTIMGKTSEPQRVRRVFEGRPWSNVEEVTVFEDTKRNNTCYVYWSYGYGKQVSCVHSPEPIPSRTQ